MKYVPPIQPLAWRHPLQPRETAVGFASRLAALNGVNLQDFARDMRIRARDIDLGDKSAVRELAVLGGLSRDATTDLLRYTPQRNYGERSSSIAGETLKPLSVARTYFRFCPHCVAEDLTSFEGARAARPWLRLEWTIRHVRSCRVHDVALVDAAPERKLFQPFDFNETLATDVLPVLDRLRAAAAHAPHSAFEDWVIARLDGVREPGNWLDDIPLAPAIAFCEALGISALHKPKVQTKFLEERAWAEAGAEGFHLASRGEKGLRELFDHLVAAQADQRGVMGLRDTYGYVYGLLEKTIDDENFAAFRSVARRHAFDNVPIEPGTVVLGEELKERRFHTVRSAAAASGAAPLSIRRLFARRGIEEAHGESGRSDLRVIVRADEISEVTEALKAAVASGIVMKMVGTSKAIFDRLVALGYLPTVNGSEKEAYAKHRFSRAAIDEMMSRFFDGAVDVDEPGPRQMPLGTARHVACCTTDDILRMVFEGRLKWKGRLRGGTKYGDLLVDADEVTALIRGETTKAGFARADLEAFIPGLGTSSYRKLIAAGILETTEEFSPEARRVIKVVTRASGEAFKARYVTLGELCQRTGLHHKQVRQRLREAGVSEAFVYEEVGTFFYERGLVEF
jgi:hypothetical protein